MDNVVILRPVETALVDLERLEDTSRSAQVQTERVLEDLAEVLSCLTRAYKESRFEEVAQRAKDTASCASALGLDRMQRVARTVCVLACGDDSAALAANLGRLSRLGEAALGTIWQAHDQRV